MPLDGIALIIIEAIEKRNHEPIYKTLTTKLSKEVKSDNIYFRKVKRAITKWRSIEKVQYCDSNIAKTYIV